MKSYHYFENVLTKRQIILFTGVGLLKVYKLIDESMTPVAQPVRRIPFEI